MTEPGNLDFVVEPAFFLKNIETPAGRTFIGYRAPLRLRYRPHEQVFLEAGAQAGHNYGDDKSLDASAPLLRLVYEPAPDVYLIAGSLIRTHPIHDALYDDTLIFQRDREEGIQVRADRQRLKQDLWLNWKVRETDTRSEQLDVGSVTQARFGNLHLDGQVLWVHTGGQRNFPHIIEHNLNFLAGGSYGFSPGGAARDFRIGGYYLSDMNIPDRDTAEPETKGRGVEGRVTLELNPAEGFLLQVFGAYFRGDDLNAREGDPLYRKDRYSQLGANLLMRLPAGLRLEFGVTVHYFDHGFESMQQLYLTWGKAFTLLTGIR